jgi:hypothetical protein
MSNQGADENEVNPEMTGALLIEIEDTGLNH